MPGYGFMGGIQSYQPGGGYGASLKNDYRRYWGASIGFSGRGEMIPNEDSYCELDPRMVDQWGIPVLRFHWKWSDHEHLQVKHMQETFRALLQEMGAVVAVEHADKEQGYGISTGGSIIHEVGGVRMGSSSTHQRVERELSGMGLQESLCRRRRAVRHPGRQESHLDDPGALDADVALHRGAAEGREAVTDSAADRR